MLRALRAFDNVFLNISEVPRSSDLPYPYSWKAFDYPERWFKTLGNLLEPSSGPSTWHDNPDEYNRFWEFHLRREVQRG